MAAKKKIEVGSLVFHQGTPPQLTVESVTKDKIVATYTDPRTDEVSTFEGAPSAFKVAK